MITSIELGDFLSHYETKLDFGNGVTVFVGQNGAGKSSIIDAITFALFGQHTRKSNKSLIRRGANQGYTKVEFDINGKQYQAIRKIDNKGGLVAKFSEKVHEQILEIAVGERKQFGESMTHEIEKTIGLNFEKLKIASIVQQGELNTIVRTKPKEFKELLNAIIGIDKLDVASETMKIIIKEFREKIKENLGYDDTHIDILFREVEQYKIDLDESIPQKEELRVKQAQLQKEIENLRTKLEEEASKIDKIKLLEIRKKELQSYAKKIIQEIQHEISEKERKIQECEGCFEQLNLKEDLESKLEKSELAIEETLRKTQELASNFASLREKQILAEKLQIKDNRCPVCNSKVERLNPMFQEQHLKQEIAIIKDQLAIVEKERMMYTQKKSEFSKKLQSVRDAEATLKAHSIKDQEEIKKIQEEIELKKRNVQKIPLLTNGSLLEISQIDPHTKMIFENITKLEYEINGFDENELLNLKKNINEKQMNLSQIDQRLGAVTEKITKNEEQVKLKEKILNDLKMVKKYLQELGLIQVSIFNRDGPVATSLRSWALNTISAKSSEYLMMLNTKIQRIHLSEKTRDIIITCYAKNETLDLESLSGGEQVSVALALRLGMASLLGASNLNLMILDEPTTHLDAERKKSLVEVLSQLSNFANVGKSMQFIIITHDSEIFENSNVERIYKFESTENGSLVTKL